MRNKKLILDKHHYERLIKKYNEKLNEYWKKYYFDSCSSSKDIKS